MNQVIFENGTEIAVSLMNMQFLGEMKQSGAILGIGCSKLSLRKPKTEDSIF